MTPEAAVYSVPAVETHIVPAGARSAIAGRGTAIPVMKLRQRGLVMRTDAEFCVPASYEFVLQEIHRLADLPKGWDSYDALPISRAARRRAVMFVNWLITECPHRLPPPTVGPSPDAGVVFRWTADDHAVTAIFLKNSAEYAVERRSTGEVVAEGRISRPLSFSKTILDRYIPV